MAALHLTRTATGDLVSADGRVHLDKVMTLPWRTALRTGLPAWVWRETGTAYSNPFAAIRAATPTPAEGALI